MSWADLRIQFLLRGPQSRHLEYGLESGLVGKLVHSQRCLQAESVDVHPLRMQVCASEVIRMTMMTDKISANCLTACLSDGCAMLHHSGTRYPNLDISKVSDSIARPPVVNNFIGIQL